MLTSVNAGRGKGDRDVREDAHSSCVWEGGTEQDLTHTHTGKGERSINSLFTISKTHCTYMVQHTLSLIQPHQQTRGFTGRK